MHTQLVATLAYEAPHTIIAVVRNRAAHARSTPHPRCSYLLCKNCCTTLRTRKRSYDSGLPFSHFPCSWSYLASPSSSQPLLRYVFPAPFNTLTLTTLDYPSSPSCSLPHITILHLTPSPINRITHTHTRTHDFYIITLEVEVRRETPMTRPWCNDAPTPQLINTYNDVMDITSHSCLNLKLLQAKAWDNTASLGTCISTRCIQCHTRVAT